MMEGKSLEKSRLKIPKRYLQGGSVRASMSAARGEHSGLCRYSSDTYAEKIASIISAFSADSFPVYLPGAFGLS